MKPAWEKLGDDFTTSKTVIVGDVDCTVEKDLCSKYGVRGYPTIKYFTGATAATGDSYEGGRTYEDLKSFADESLGPSCGADNKDLCDEAQLKVITDAEAMSADDLEAAIKEKTDEIAAAEEHLKTSVAKLQQEYQDLNAAKDKTVGDISPGLRLLRSVQSSQKAGGAGHDEL
jgi:thioredoxin-like negative regulator of GroEL